MSSGVSSAQFSKQREVKLRYEIVYDLVLDLIAQNGLKPGDRLPSTSELVKLAGVSLISVRHALDKLENAGRIVRQQGVGTFVAREKILSEPGRPGGLLQTLSTQGAGPELTTELLGLSLGMPSPAVAQAMAMAPGQPVWDLRRRRCLGKTPAILEQAILPLNIVPALNEDLLASGGSLYRYLSEVYGLSDAYSEQVIEVARPDPAEAEQLNLTGRDRVVRIRGLSATAGNVVFDCWRQTYRATDFLFYSAASGGSHLLPTTKSESWEVIPLTTGRPAAKPGRGD